MRCTVIQLARVGDLAQSVPLLRALKSSGRRVTLICPADPGTWIRHWADELRVVDLQGISGLAGDPVGLMRELHKSLGDLLSSEVDELYCLNEAAPALGLRALLPARRCWGFGDETHPAVAWMRELTTRRVENRIHLSEWQLALRPDLEAEVSAARTRAQGPLVIHAGSGHPARRLEGEFWKALLKELGTRMPGTRILLSGSGSEASFCEALAAGQAHVESLAGRTSLDDLLGLIGEARLLLAQDTGVLHLAALTDTPLLGLYHASARAFETGPFQHGARVLEIVADCHPCVEGLPPCGDFTCRASLDPARVAAEAAALAVGDPPPPADESLLRGYTVDFGEELYLLQPAEGLDQDRIEEKRRQLAQVRGELPFKLPGVSRAALEDLRTRGLGFVDLQRRFGLPEAGSLSLGARYREAAACLSSGESR